MLTIIATPKITKWLDENLNKYAQSSPNKTINQIYEAVTNKGESFKITVYNNGTLTIQGNIKQRIYQKLIVECGEENYIGCDEVGVGDFLGPTVYVAVKFNQSTIEQLAHSNLPIRDSKKLTDTQIKQVFNETSNFIEYSSQVVYDYQIENLNSIGQKVYYHYQNVFVTNNDINDTTVIDLFTTINSFYKYSKELEITWPDNIILETKADNKFLTVALASIYARAIFLEEMAKLEAKYNFTLPLGAGAKPKTAAQEFINQFSKDELATFCKTSFKTFNEIE